MVSTCRRVLSSRAGSRSTFGRIWIRYLLGRITEEWTIALDGTTLWVGLNPTTYPVSRTWVGDHQYLPGERFPRLERRSATGGCPYGFRQAAAAAGDR